MPRFSRFPLCALATGLCFGTHLHSARAQARISLGPRVGVNVASAKFNYSGTVPYTFTTESVTRLETGVVANINYRHFSWQPALLYAQKGFVLTGTKKPSIVGSSRPARAELTRRLNYLTLPVNVAYTQKASGEGWQVFGGGYVGLLLGGKRTVHNQYEYATGTYFYDSEQPIRPGAEAVEADAFYAQRWDAGLQAGVGYRCGAALLQVTYSAGLTNADVLSALQEPQSYYNRTVQAAFAYLLPVGKQVPKQRINN
ncbi:outer membrane beta-barrel protein [Hymenobacter nivis]|uniref:Outer membrane protein beta-barrel domain-containing protein n=1 Tax=Hymenobacter nivis TaxID=1850093 RepID=A0A2Z3GRV8_9BACT|nr:outer membrane beta-barrel protein [Hymenobacter nivis]AWM34106.1 hypothetical protein DDQ68_15730 [Hymenobacter nivis]